LEKLEVQESDLIFRKGENFYHYYKVGNIIGDETVSKARFCENLKTKQAKAVKIYEKSTIPDLGTYMSKVQILDSLYHPNILKYDEIFEDKDRLYFVSDVMTGGDLYDAVTNKGNYTEHDAAHIMR